MINLLPQEEKLELKLEVKKRIALILSFLAIFFIFCLSLILFGVEYYIREEKYYQENFIKEFQRQQNIPELEDIQNKLISFNKTLAKIDFFYSKKIYFSDIIEKIAEIIPQKSYLKNLSLDSLPGDPGKKEVKIFISGFVSERDDLFTFKKALEQEPGAKEIFFPPSDWTQPRNIDFQANFKISK